MLSMFAFLVVSHSLVLFSLATSEVCSSVCIPSKANALVQCAQRSNNFARCSVVPCHENGKARGWKCHPWKIVFPSAVNVSPIPVSRGCLSTCRTHRKQATKDCWVRGRPIRGCYVKRCASDEKDKGWECAPLPSPAVNIHRGCRNLCYVHHEPARDDCWFQGRPVAGCQIAPCVERKVGKGETNRGWACGPVQEASESVQPSGTEFVTESPSPTLLQKPFITMPYSSPEESATPLISPSASPLPRAADQDASFISLSHVSGRVADNRVENFGSPSPQPYEVKYEGMLATRGIVSLEALHGRLSVNCTTDGTVQITIGRGVSVSSLERMYPKGAVLAVSREMFGSCELSAPLDSENVNEFDVEDEDESSLRGNDARQQKGSEKFRDTFLFIENVSGAPSDAIIQGTPTSYFALFDSLKLSVKAVNPNFNDSTRVVVGSKEAGRTNLPISERITGRGSISNSWSIGLLDIQASLELAYFGGIKAYKVKFNRRSVDISVTIYTGWKANVKMEATIKVGVGSIREEFDFISLPMYGLQTIDFFKNSKGASIPKFKLGVILEVPLLVQAAVDLTKSLPLEAELSYESEVTDTTYSLNGPYNNIRTDTTKKVFKPSAFSPTAEIAAPNVKPVALEASVFAGIAPAVALYLPLISARSSVDAGVQVKVSTALSGPFAPDTDRNALLKLGVCDKCHEIKADVTGKVKNPKLIIILGIDITVDLIFKEFQIKKTKTLVRKRFPELQFSMDVFKSCLFEWVNENGLSLTCGTECCNQLELEESDIMCQIIDGRSSCHLSPSPTPEYSTSPSPSPQPSPTPISGVVGSTYTDPHLRTFDGLSFDCQAIGEFIMVKSDRLQLEIQARFEGLSSQGTVTKAIAVKTKNSPTIEFSIPSSGSSSSADLSGCPVHVLVNGESRTLKAGLNALADNIQITMSSSLMLLSYSTGMSISFSQRNSASFGCFLERLNIFLPQSVTRTGAIIGLLGSPNGNPLDDWTKSDGTVLKLPEDRLDRILKPAYDYCRTQWCVRNKTESLFTHKEGKSFTDVDRCDMKYGDPPNFASAPVTLQSLCGTNEECLVDGLAGSIEDARATLHVQFEEEITRSAIRKFRFEPSALAAPSTVNIVVTLDLREKPSSAFENLDHIAVYKVNSIQTNLNSAEPIVLLFDDGSTVHSDAASDDRIFTNAFALPSGNAGRSLSFRAVPVYAGGLDINSPLASIALEAVRTYSEESDIGKTDPSTSTTNKNSATINVKVNEIELLVTYSWPLDQNDLDTATNFLGGTVGFSCDPESSYMNWESGDDTSSGGQETTIVQLGLSRKHGKWDASTSVDFRAGWFGFGTGPATLRMVLRKSSTDEEIPDSALTSVIIPGIQSQCASTVVGTLQVNVGRDTVSLRLKGTI